MYSNSINSLTVYGKPPDSIFHVDRMIMAAKLVYWLPVGAIRWKKYGKKVRKIS